MRGDKGFMQKEVYNEIALNVAHYKQSQQVPYYSN